VAAGCWLDVRSWAWPAAPIKQTEKSIATAWRIEVSSLEVPQPAGARAAHRAELSLGTAESE
jgi:hypothetical protein